MAVLVWVLAVLFLIQLPANVCRKVSENALSAWAPATSVGNLDGVWPGLDRQTVVAILEVSQQIEDPSFFLPFKFREPGIESKKVRLQCLQIQSLLKQSAQTFKMDQHNISE